MGATNSVISKEDAFFKVELIEKLLQFGNQYEESLAIMVRKTELTKLTDNMIENQDLDNKPTDVLSLWKKVSQQT